jgi:hypothetical protein
MQTTTVDFDLQKSFVNRDTVVSGGVVYSIITEKKVYSQREYLRAKFVVHNQSNKTVKFGGVGPGHLCTYSMTLTDQNEKKVYSTTDNLGCPALYTEWDLKPGEKDSINFNPYFLGGDYTKLTVTGQMIGKDSTKVSVDVDVLKMMVASQPMSSHTLLSKRVIFNSATSSLQFALERPQNVRISAYLLNGKAVKELSSERFLAAGNHVVSFDRLRAMHCVLVVLVKGEDFSEIKRIRLMQ